MERENAIDYRSNHRELWKHVYLYKSYTKLY